ncbi:MAG: hypothetical protein V1808_02770 [Candidatus Daviesbacteria bacterium]
MLKFFSIFLITLSFLIFTSSCQASNNSYVTVVNPIRGNDFWDQKDQRPIDVVVEEAKTLNQFGMFATWLLRYDACSDEDIINLLKTLPYANEKGLFLEITPSWTKSSGVNYRQSSVWHQAGSVFLTGYQTYEREKLIDTAFAKFKENFGFYPKSVGAWWIDSFSLNYMQKKYGITAALIVADQYTTDNYQIWGQYWSAPYYPSLKNALIPAQTRENKIPVVIMQWAARDPVNGYGDGVLESTYSVQANDYLDYHKLKTEYFSKLVDTFTTQKLNQFNHLVVGLENSYSWNKYGNEYKNQMQVLSNKKDNGYFFLFTMQDFAKWYQEKFPDTSPEHIIVADDPLGTYKKTVWFMNPYYRIGWFYNKDGSVFRDIRQYIETIEEPCLNRACDQINFATFSTRVLDDVTYKQKLIVDQGKLQNFKVQKEQNVYTLSYQNEAGRVREIKFLPRDISVDGNIKSIDSFILDAQTLQKVDDQNKINLSSPQLAQFQETLLGFSTKLVKFILFLFIALFIPGYLFVKQLEQNSFFLNIFLSISTGFVTLALVSFLGGYLHCAWLNTAYIMISLIIFIFKKYYKTLDFSQIKFTGIKSFSLEILIIISGTFFQSLAMIRSGWVYNFGVGFLGPTGHDGIWHQALINELTKHIPPENPAFSGQPLTNYHYFYDLLVASTFNLSQIPVEDLLYRFYPVLLSILLGIGTYFLISKMINKKMVILISLYFVYFAGSFGWIAEYLKTKTFGGESTFWVNQPVSMNLNPPFAISLVIIIAIILVFWLVLKNSKVMGQILIILLVGPLIGFKIYAAVVVLGGLGLVSLQQLIFSNNKICLKIFLGSLLLSLSIFIPQSNQSTSLLIFSPFWFIHSMVDFPDRLGWLRLSQARSAYLARGEWFKFILAESVSFMIFLIGNLGIRLVALYSIFKFFKAKLWKSPFFLFIFSMSFISLMIPIFFIQKGNHWNSIQFFYYFLYFAAIFAGFIFESIYKRLPKLIGVILLISVFIISPINSFATFRNGFDANPPARLTLGELEALNFLKQLPDGVVLTYPYDKNLRYNFINPYPLFSYETTAYVSAFAAKHTFIEDEMQQEILLNDYKKRLVAATDFFKGIDLEWSKQFIVANNISYIYLPKAISNSLEIEKIGGKKVFENDEVGIFKMK